MTILPINLALKLVYLLQGKTLPAGAIKHPILEEWIQDGIIERTGRIQKKLSIPDPVALLKYIENKYGIRDLSQYLAAYYDEYVSRGQAIAVSSQSKITAIRTFKGFLVNCYFPIRATLGGRPVTLNPPAGTFQFIYDFADFRIPQDITIVGIENPENFRHIEKQKYLFRNIKPLFVSRYPQSQSKDLLRWLQSIPNRYLHFGDFDFAGIGIYLNEYKKHLGDKTAFFVPENIDILINKYGNKNLYDIQKINFNIDEIEEEHLLRLINSIHKYKKGLEQEILRNEKIITCNTISLM